MSLGPMDFNTLYGPKIREQLERETLMLRRISRPTRKGHQGQVDPAVAAAHAEFEKRWDALLAEGLGAGYLEYDYEGLTLREPEREWIWDETEEEFQARLKREQCNIGDGGHVVFPVSKGPRP